MNERMVKKYNRFMLSSILLSGLILAVFEGPKINYAADLPQNKSPQNDSFPKIVFQSTDVHVGLVKPNGKAQGEFIFENKGKANLVLKRVAPT